MSSQKTVFTHPFYTSLSVWLIFYTFFVMFCAELLMLKFHIMEVCICQIAPSVWGENYKQEREREVLNYMLSQTPIMPSQKDDSSKQCSYVSRGKTWGFI